MDPVSTVFGGCLAAMAAWQAVMMVSTLRRLWTPAPPPLQDSECPPALVVLCLRGGDPFLNRTLDALLQQDYPQYRVRVMIDSPEDEARSFVNAALAGSRRADQVEVLTLTQRFDSCTYKMSGILAATESLPPQTRFVALLDGDTVLHRTWLRELAAPIVRDGIEVATGNRWYAPERATLPNMIRVWWASSALSLMQLFRIPWGGTMAVRADIIQNPHLRERIRHAFSEDTTIGQFVREQGGEVRLTPGLMIVNREDIDVAGMFNFDTRQLLTVRMQHSAWFMMSLHGLLGAMWVVFPILRGWWDGEMWVRVMFRTVLGLLCLQGLLLDFTVRRQLRKRGEALPAWGPLRILAALGGLTALPFLHLAASLRALIARTIVWRGVRYRLGGTPPVQVEQDLWLAPARPVRGSMIPGSLPKRASKLPRGRELPV